MKKYVNKAFVLLLAMAVTLTAIPIYGIASETGSVSGNELNFENMDVENHGGYSEDNDDIRFFIENDEPFMTPNWNFTTSQIKSLAGNNKKIYIKKGTIKQVMFNQCYQSVKIENKDIFMIVNPSFLDDADRYLTDEKKSTATWKLENGYYLSYKPYISGEEVGRTRIFTWNHDLQKGDIIEAICVEPYISVDASDSYKIAENESFSFDVDYTGDFGIAVSNKEVADFTINGNTVTVTGKKKGTVDFKLVQLKDDLTFNDVYSSVSGSTPESKSISLTVGTDAKLSASVTSLSLNAGESKDFTVSGTVKGVTNALKQTSFSLYNSTGNKKVADVVIGSVSGTNQKVTVKAVSGLSDTTKVNLTLKDTYSGTSFSIPVTISPAGTTVSPTVKPTTNPTVKPTVTPPVKKMAETVIVKRVASSVTVKKGKTVKATSNYKVSDKSKVSKVTYKTSNKKVASISKSGKIKGVKKGSATITVTITFKDKSTKKFTYKVKVK